MVQNASDFAKHGPDVLGTNRDINVKQLLDSQREALLVGHHGDIVETVEVGQRLEVCPVLDELLCASMQQSYMGVGAHNLLSSELKNQAQHAVGSGMLGPKVDSVMPNLPCIYMLVGLGLGFLGGLSGCDAPKVGVGRNQARSLALFDFGVSARE